MENREDDAHGLSPSSVDIPDEMDVPQQSMEDSSDCDEIDGDVSSDEKSNTPIAGITSLREISLPQIRIPDDSECKDMGIPDTPTPFAVPSLRGKFRLSTDSAKYVCRGLWAMSDALHEVAGQTSDFEFQLVQPPIKSDTIFPVSGKYSGWFILQQPNQKAPIKVEDKEINIRFEMQGDGDHKIEGEGHNKFGKFSVYGTLGGDGTLQMYRVYTPKPLSTTNKSKKGMMPKKLPGPPTPKILSSTPTGGPPVKHTGKVSKPPTLALPAGNASTAAPLSSRETSARSRRTTFNSYETADVPSDEPSTSRDSRDSLVTSAVAVAREKDGRTPRLTQHMLKCSEMLKDLSRQPQAMWFNEPVDFVKLSIPDYPSIIKEPMDFKTIRLNLERLHYKSPEEFAEHIRLTFRNAITYNTSRDNPVHIAAREMSNRFEEKYRVMMSQFGSSAMLADYDTSYRGSTPSGGGKKSKKSHAPSKRMSNGPRAMEVDGSVPMVMDSNMLTVMDDLNRKIREMQSEITQLRSVVKHTDVKSERTEKYEKVKRAPMLEPLTLEEKRALISRIHKLAPERMAKVVDIIQSALPPSDKEDSDEVEIPLDELDTKTLRRLQDYVQNVPSVQPVAAKRKRQYPAGGSGGAVGRPPSSSSSIASKEKSSSVKRLKGPEGRKSAALVPNVNSSSSDQGMNPPMGLFFSSTTAAPSSSAAAAPPASVDEFKFNGLDDDEDFPEIYVPESDTEKEQEPSSLALSNAVAWNSELSDVKVKMDTVSMSVESGSMGGDNGMWGEAKSEKLAQLHRDAERKIEEERLQKLKSKMEYDRQLAQQSAFAQSEQAKKAEVRLAADEQARRLDQQREDERLRRESLTQTVVVDNSADVMMMMEDV